MSDVLRCHTHILLTVKWFLFTVYPLIHRVRATIIYRVYVVYYKKPDGTN